MSIQSEITRIAGNVTESINALEELGVNATNSNELPGAIRAIPRAEVVQNVGNSETAVMSQKAVTDALNALGVEPADDDIPKVFLRYSLETRAASSSVSSCG